MCSESTTANFFATSFLQHVSLLLCSFKKQKLMAQPAQRVYLLGPGLSLSEVIMRSRPLAFFALFSLTSTGAFAASIKSQLSAELCLDVAGGQPVNGAHAQLARCSDNPAQAWTQEGATLRALGKCLHVRNGSQTPGATVQLSDCTEQGGNQEWVLRDRQIQWKGTNLCLDVPEGRAADGQPLQVWTCGAANKNQLFATALGQATPLMQGANGAVIVPAQSPAPAPQGTKPAAPSVAPAPAPAIAAPASQAPALPAPSEAGGRTMRFVNNCHQTIWVAGQQNGDKQALPGDASGFELKAGATRDVVVPAAWGGRFWGRTGCVVSGSSRTVCETGDCGNQLVCHGIGGQPTSLAEFLFDGWAGDGKTQDYYDISHVDAYNVGLKIAPLGGSGACVAPTCAADINQQCPADLQVKNHAGQVVACLSSCERYGTDEMCCAGAHNRPETCPAPPGARLFKQACPAAYSYAYDDGTSTWNCTKPAGYALTFCPSA